MSRYRKESNLESGSDSFLDIIANIVGILIILIVIAGVRVSQMPATAEREPVVEEPQPVVVEIPPPPVLEVALGEATDQPDADILPPEPPPQVVELPPEPDPEPPKPIEPSPQLLADITLLDQELKQFSQNAAEMDQQLEDLKAAQQQAAQDAKTIKDQAQQALASLDALTTRLAKQKQEISNDQTHLALLAEEIEAQAHSNDEPEVKKLMVRMTPVSQIVEGEEYHFRLADNRVSFVPLKQLIDRLKDHLGETKSRLARSRTHQGIVGPIDGYRMRYLVERGPLSMVDELKLGQGVFRVSVSAWQLQTTADLKAETLEEALQLGSNFVRTLKAAPPKTTLTMWVYPDSFGLFRELQSVAHANGFNVAARPLPDGVPIAGSPSGTRSAGQ